MLDSRRNGCLTDRSLVNSTRLRETRVDFTLSSSMSWMLFVSSAVRHKVELVSVTALSTSCCLR